MRNILPRATMGVWQGVPGRLGWKGALQISWSSPPAGAASPTIDHGAAALLSSRGAMAGGDPRQAPQASPQTTSAGAQGHGWGPRSGAPRTRHRVPAVAAQSQRSACRVPAWPSTAGRAPADDGAVAHCCQTQAAGKNSLRSRRTYYRVFRGKAGGEGTCGAKSVEMEREKCWSQSVCSPGHALRQVGAVCPAPY